jgi:hypothetical protein
MTWPPPSDPDPATYCPTSDSGWPGTDDAALRDSALPGSAASHPEWAIEQKIEHKE